MGVCSTISDRLRREKSARFGHLEFFGLDGQIDRLAWMTQRVNEVSVLRSRNPYLELNQ